MKGKIYKAEEVLNWQFCLYKTKTGKNCNVKVSEFGEICEYHKKILKRPPKLTQRERGVKKIQEWLS